MALSEDIMRPGDEILYVFRIYPYDCTMHKNGMRSLLGTIFECKVYCCMHMQIATNVDNKSLVYVSCYCVVT